MRIDIKDRIASGDDKYIIEELEDGRVRLIPSPDSVTEEGTPLNKETLQPIADAVPVVFDILYDKEKGTGTIINEQLTAKDLWDALEEQKGVKVNIVIPQENGSNIISTVYSFVRDSLDDNIIEWNMRTFAGAGEGEMISFFNISLNELLVVDARFLSIDRIDVTYDQVGAAPAGYGLGEGGKAFFPTSEAELNNILDGIISTMPGGATGFYRIYDNDANIWGGSCMFVTLSKFNDTYATADFRSYAYTTSRLFKTRNEGGWHSLEWLNPPMAIGKEYKTVEKWQRESGGRIYSVYKRSVVFGTLPDTSYKSRQVNIGSNFEIIDYKGIITKNNTTFVSMSATNLIDSTWISKSNTTATVGVNTVSDATEYSMIVELKYVKL